MPRIYDVNFTNVTVSAAQDLVSTAGTAAKFLRCKRVYISSTSTAIPTAQMIQLRVKHATATYAAGSGGTTPTPTRRDPGDAAATFTPHVNDTTPATGTFVNDMSSGCHVYAGFDYTFGQGQEPTVNGTGEGLVFELLSTVSGTIAFSGGMTIEESGA